MAESVVINYLGVMVNVDDSIRCLPLTNGFRMETRSLQSILELAAELEAIPVKAVADSWFKQHVIALLMQGHWGKSREDVPVYVVTACQEVNKPNKRSQMLNSPKGSDLVEATEDLKDKLRALRLCKEGNPLIIYDWFFFKEEGMRKMLGAGTNFFGVETELFHLSSGDIPAIKNSLATLKLPSANDYDYVEHSFGQFEHSYGIYGVQLRFLTCAIGLEMLFGSTAESVARNAAVLLGKAENESHVIYGDMRSLQKKRNDYVHGSASPKITRDDVRLIRHYLRESIKAIQRTGFSREQLHKVLRSRGFGQGTN